MHRRTVLCLLTAVVLSLFGVGPATAEPVPDLGPPLTVPQTMLDAALTCSEPLEGVTRDPVLLSAAFATDQGSFGWNYLKTFPERGIPVCSLSLPDKGYGDLQIYAQYVVNAVRSMSSHSGRQVALMGHQHGPLYEMWALRFWPDLPALVSDFISLATPFNGTDVAQVGCSLSKKCPPASWQIATGSKFLDAMNAKPLPVGPSYTSIYTKFDELIVPQPRASTLEGGTSIALQDVCPLRPVEHFSILSDYLAFSLALDALDHGGPADPNRMPHNVCWTLLTPHVDLIPGSVVASFDTLTGAALFGPSRSIEAEPMIEAYAR